MVKRSTQGIVLMRNGLVAFVLAMTLSACASNGPIASSPGIQQVNSSEMPLPGRTEIVAESRPYLIGPFDKLRVEVFGVEELQRDVQADAGGRFLFPLIGVVQASGKTPVELAQDIGTKLSSKFVRNPEVTVNLRETVSQVLTVDGQVSRPGSYPVVGRMTLIRAVANAGGTGEFANLSDVIIFRTVDNTRYAGLYNLKAIRRGNYEDPEVFANDVIVVGDSPSRRIFKDFLQAAPLLVAPLITILNN